MDGRIMPSNTTFNPINVGGFDKTKLTFDAQGVSATMAAATSSNLDYTLVDDCLITGIELIINNGNYGDTANLQIIDLTGEFSGTPGTILNQFATKWNLAPVSDTQFDLPYPAKILMGMTLRVVYASTGLIDPFIAVNYKLHKVLI
jgi:hypothetical protein